MNRFNVNASIAFLTFLTFLYMVKGYSSYIAFTFENEILNTFQYRPEDQLFVIVYPNGSLRLSISAFTEKVFIDVYDVKEGFHSLLIIFRNLKKLTVKIGFDLTKISLEEAKIKAEEIVKRINKKFSIILDFTHREIIDYTHPRTYQRIYRVTFQYETMKIDTWKIIDIFMKLKPNEGFFSLLKRDVITGNYKLEFILLHLTQTAEIKVQLIFSRLFPSFFKFKSGRTYVLDIFKLLNYTGSIITHKTLDSVFFINLQYPSGLSYKITRIEISIPYTIGKQSNKGIIIDNFLAPPQYGATIDRMIIEFKVVESGFKILLSIQLIGYLILIFILIFLIFIFYHFGLFSKIIKSLAML